MLMQTSSARKSLFRHRGLPVIAALTALCAASAQAAPATAAKTVRTSSAGLAPCNSIRQADPALVTLGKSTLIKLPAPVVRMVVGGLGTGMAGRPVETESGTPPAPGAQQMARAGNLRTGVADADIMLLGPRELYVIGKRVGSMNLILQSETNECTVMDIAVAMDASSLQAKFAELMPGEKNIKVAAAEDTLIVSGEVADAVKLERALTLAAAYAPDKRVVNMLRAAAASQVMLEVKVAEVSKSILDKLGARVVLGGGTRYTLISDFLTGSNGVLQALSSSGKRSLVLDGELKDGIVRVLAEPNIMAVSGQQASFLSGGKIFIPVSYTPAGGVGFPTITLEEKEFGVGVKFTPTVLEGNRINLKVASEVSELTQTGSPFTTSGGVTAILPSFTTRRADTTVQLRDGQSFAIAGLIKNNLTETVQRFPGLGDIPILGALFRSTEFQKDMTELLFIITPRLVKPLAPEYALPTDAYKEPSRGDALFNGALESGEEPKPAPQKPAAPVSDAGAVEANKPQAAAAAAPVATSTAVPPPAAPRLMPTETRPPARIDPQAGAPAPGRDAARARPTAAPVVADASAAMNAEAIGRFYAEP